MTESIFQFPYRKLATRLLGSFANRASCCTSLASVHQSWSASGECGPKALLVHVQQAAVASIMPLLLFNMN